MLNPSYSAGLQADSTACGNFPPIDVARNRDLTILDNAERLAMRHSMSKMIAATVMAFMLLAAVSAAAVPTVRHIASGWWNIPEGLAALPEGTLQFNGRLIGLSANAEKR